MWGHIVRNKLPQLQSCSPAPKHKKLDNENSCQMINLSLSFFFIQIQNYFRLKNLIKNKVISYFWFKNKTVMKQFTIRIPDNKVDLFMELMKSISFVKSIEEEKIVDIPEEHKSVVRERIQKYGDKTDNYLDWDKIEVKLKSVK